MTTTICEPKGSADYRQKMSLLYEQLVSALYDIEYYKVNSDDAVADAEFYLYQAQSIVQQISETEEAEE